MPPPDTPRLGATKGAVGRIGLAICEGLDKVRGMELEQHYSALLGLGEPWRVKHVELSVESQRVQIRIEWKGSKEAACAQCGSASPLYDLREERRWRHLDTTQFETVICCRTPRCRCPEHGVCTVAKPWADKHGRFTLQFELFAVKVLQACSNVQAARKLLGLSWAQADEIRRRAVERGLARRGQEPIAYLGLDEKSFGRYHDYISVLTDLKGGRVLEVALERKQEAGEKLLLTLSAEQRAEALGIAMDMWPAYMKAARKHVPEAVLVHDKFHVCKHLNDVVDGARRAENKTLGQSGDDRLKGTRYLFLKRTENLSKGHRERLQALRNSNLNTARAWAIKEEFTQFRNYEFGHDAKAFFDHWYSWAIRSRLKPLKEKARMLKKHLEGLLSYVLHPITNAVTEGLNSKIQNIKASARGFRSFQRYRIAILFYCGKLDMMPMCSPFPQKP